MINANRKYLYLTEKSWVRSWVLGGEIPINLASYYRSDTRSGVTTPDEVVQRNTSGIYSKGFSQVVNVSDKSSVDIRVSGEVSLGDHVVGRNVKFVQSQEDGLILSFCNVFDPHIAIRLGKKACVEVFDIYSVLHHISSQLGVEGVAKSCQYTDSYDRNHFLKGLEDSWQKEYRLFWKHEESRKVILPPGLCREISI